MLVATTDAAVVAWDDRDPAPQRVLQLVEAKGTPVHAIGALERAEGEEGPRT